VHRKKGNAGSIRNGTAESDVDVPVAQVLRIPPAKVTSMSEPDPFGRNRPRPNRSELFGTISAPVVQLAKSVVNDIGQKFLLLPAGQYRGGSASTESGHRTNEAPQHDVVLTRNFYIASVPTTQLQWHTIMKPASLRGRSPAPAAPSNEPAVDVTWNDANLFCDRASNTQEARQRGYRYRLPTEAEWEYACRAETATPYFVGTTLTAQQACISDTRGPGPVARYEQNHFGLYDMHGLVWEWCADWYAENAYANRPMRDPAGPEFGTLRVLRGGSWRHGPGCARSAYRNALAPHQKDRATGFRVVLEVSA
jgi:formylglycine-generating enzyme